MACVIRSKRSFNFSKFETNDIGPGEYFDDWSKSDFVKRGISEYNKVHIKNIGFNSTSRRDDYFKPIKSPGPCAYNATFLGKKDFHKFNLNKGNSEEKEILSSNAMRTVHSDKQGFLSSQKRFVEPLLLNNEEKIEYEEDKGNEGRIYGKKGKIMGKGTLIYNANISLKPGSKNIIHSIPSKGDYEYKIKGGKVLTYAIDRSSQRKENKSNLVGPGSYNIFPSWKKKVSDWKKGVRKEENYRDKVIKELNERANI